MRGNGVEAAIARYREFGKKKDAHNRNCAQIGSAYLGVLLYYRYHINNNSLKPGLLNVKLCTEFNDH